MNLIIASEADSASLNLKSRLLEMAKWVEDGDFNGKRVWKLTEDYGAFCLKDTRLITIEELHIHAEGIDKEWEEKTDMEIENIVFLSHDWSRTCFQRVYNVYLCIL